MSKPVASQAASAAKPAVATAMSTMAMRRQGVTLGLRPTTAVNGGMPG
jgi:hypothetical protein